MIIPSRLMPSIKSADCPFSVFFPLPNRVQYLLSQGSEYICRYKNADLYWFIPIFQSPFAPKHDYCGGNIAPEAWELDKIIIKRT